MPSEATQFTAANAREMAAKAHEAKRQRAIMRENGEIPQPLLPEEKFRLLTLARVRKQMERNFSMMNDEEDAGKLDRLASAQARLSEMERQLAGRPLPGSLRPASNRRQRAPEVQPIQPASSVEIPTPSKPMGWEYDL